MVRLAVLVAAVVAIAAPLSAQAQSESAFDGVIEGRIVNGTADGDAVGSVPLSLLVFRRMTAENEVFGRSDSEGRFRFDGLEVHSDMRYFVQAGYKDVAYRSPAVQIFPDLPSFTEVNVWETTTSDADVIIDRASVAFPTVDGSVGLVGVLEIVTLINQGDRTYVGDLFEDPENGGAVRVSLPGNALEINLGHGFGPDGFVVVPGGVINKAPLLPGPSEMIYGYAIPYVGTTAALERRYLYNTRNVTVLMPDDVGDFNSSQLDFAGPVDVSGEPHTLFTKSDVPPGQFFELRLSELPVFADLSSSGVDFDTVLRYAAVGILIAIAAGAAALAVTHRVTSEPSAASSSDLNTLAEERAGLIDSLATLDIDFESGRITQDEYDRQRYAGKRRLIDVALLLEEESPPRGAGA